MSLGSTDQVFQHCGRFRSVPSPEQGTSQRTRSYLSSHSISSPIEIGGCRAAAVAVKAQELLGRAMELCGVLGGATEDHGAARVPCLSPETNSRRERERERERESEGESESEREGEPCCAPFALRAATARSIAPHLRHSQ